MNHTILQYTPQLEQDLIALHTGNNQAKQWFYQSVIDILENPKLSAFTKADQIADPLQFSNLPSLQYYLLFHGYPRTPKLFEQCSLVALHFERVKYCVLV